MLLVSRGVVDDSGITGALPAGLELCCVLTVVAMLVAVVVVGCVDRVVVLGAKVLAVVVDG